MGDDSWNAHIAYLEVEVKKIAERVEKLEKMIPDLKNKPREHLCRKRIPDLKDEANEHRKYLALVKQFIYRG